MLDSELCRRCLCQELQSKGFLFEADYWRKNKPKFDTAWETDGIVCCAKTSGELGWVGLFSNQAPANCPYALEHLMREQTKC